jgi:hypothetical protein
LGGTTAGPLVGERNQERGTHKTPLKDDMHNLAKPDGHGGVGLEENAKTVEAAVASIESQEKWIESLEDASARRKPPCKGTPPEDLLSTDAGRARRQVAG